MWPESQFPYIMLTRRQCKKVAWREMKAINKVEDLGCVFNETDLVARLPGGSTIEFYGADKPGWMETMRGAKNRGAAIDEAQSFSIDIGDSIQKVIRPTLIDQRGEMFVAGTPGILTSGFFYHITQKTGKYHGWEIFNWSTADNPHVREQYLEELNSIRAEHPGVDILTLPWVRREYFGEWIIDRERAVYEFDPARNGVNEFEPLDGDQYIGGIDFGWHDRTAFVVGVYNPSKRPDFIVLESLRYPKLLIDQVADQVREFQEQYPGIEFVGDYARRQLLEELSARADIHIEPAEKSEKKDYIELLNRDLLSARIKVLNPGSSKVAEEMTDLKWVTRPSGKVEEQPAQPNDCCDCLLYAWRRAYHYTHRNEAQRPKVGTPEYYKQQEDEMFKAAIRRQQGSKKDWWDRG